MKVNKLLKELDEKSRKKYENDNFLEEMKSDVVVKANHNKSFFLLFAVSLVVIIVAITLICVYCIPTENIYFAENEIFESSTLEQINKTSKEFQVFECDGYEFTYKKTIDKKSEVLLSYFITVVDDSELSQLQIRIIVNERFQYSENIETLTKKEAYNNFSMQYIENIKDEHGVYSFESKGYIQKNKEQVYILYKGFSLEEKSGLTKLIGQILSSK